MNLLTDPVIQVREEGVRTASAHTLPEVLAMLLGPEPVADFPNVAAEQHGHWWRILVRCAAHALHSTVGADFSDSPSADLIRNALHGTLPETAWDLFVEDVRLPAFLQPAVPEKGGTLKPIGDLSPYSGSRNHERKNDRLIAIDAEALLYTLVEVQFGAVYGGRGHLGSQLMGSQRRKGSGSPFVGIQIGTSLNEAFLHDVVVTLETWDATVQDLGLAGSVWALWCEPWDGAVSLPAKHLNPAFIPLARRVRAHKDADGLCRRFLFHASKVARVADHTNGGNLGDPFAPLVPNAKHRGAPKIRGTMEDGYTYREAVKLLFGLGEPAATPPGAVLAAAARPDLRGRPDVRVIMAGVASTENGTSGFHRREILLPQGAGSLWGQPDAVREAHDRMLKDVVTATRALRGAVALSITGPNRKSRDLPPGVRPWLARFEQGVDAIYLDHLLASALSPTPEAAAAWVRELRGLARSIFSDATRSVRSYEVLAHAETHLNRWLPRVAA